MEMRNSTVLEELKDDVKALSNQEIMVKIGSNLVGNNNNSGDVNDDDNESKSEVNNGFCKNFGLMLDTSHNVKENMFELVEELIKLQAKYGRKQNSVPFGERDVPQAIMEEKEKLILEDEDEDEDEQEDSCAEDKKSEDGKTLDKQNEMMMMVGGCGSSCIDGNINNGEGGNEGSSGDNDKQISLYTLIQRHKSYKRKLRKWRKLTRTLFTIVFPDFKNDATSEELLPNVLEDVVMKFKNVRKEIETQKRQIDLFENLIMAIKSANAKNELLLSNLYIGRRDVPGSGSSRSLDGQQIMKRFISVSDCINCCVNIEPTLHHSAITQSQDEEIESEEISVEMKNEETRVVINDKDENNGENITKIKANTKLVYELIPLGLMAVLVFLKIRN